MDSLLVEGYSKSPGVFNYNTVSLPSVFSHQDSSSRITISHDSRTSSSSILSYDPDLIHAVYQTSSSSSESSELSPCVGDSPEAPDFPDACIKFLSDILMEEDLDEKPTTHRDYMALQATEKSLYDAIGKPYLPPSDHIKPFLGPTTESPDEFNGSSHAGDGYTASESTVESNWVLHNQFGSSSPRETTSPSSGSAGGAEESSLSSVLSAEITYGNFNWIQKALSSFTNIKNPEGYITSHSGEWKGKSNQVLIEADTRSGSAVSLSRGRKNHQRDDSDDDQDGRSSKHLESYKEDEVQMEQYDDILLCREGKLCFPTVSSVKEESKTTPQLSEKAKGSKGKGLRGKKHGNVEDVVDLNPLLNQCAQAVASFDFRGANELLKRIRQHSSPFGDGIQRVVHYFANGLEARLAGTASQLYSDFINWQISASLFLKAYRSYVSAVPFKRTCFFLANKTLLKLCAKATQIHIIDFGIFFGTQWPCIIQSLSQRPEGPPKLKITAVEFPQRGYQPAARVEETGKRLAGYCRRFNVPFEYHAIAQRWDTLLPEDFRIERDEMLVVNCLYKSRALLDDTIEADSPRDVFLKLIRRLNPALFIHGIVNGTYNAPFFTTRFKEALYHYSTVFDLFEATMPREDDERQLIERELYGRDIINVVACEGAERVDRPETYKQWQVRNQRAGFRQVPLDREIVKKAKAMVKANYHKDFVVSEDKNWMLQGWKGRLLYAVSCWKPA